jgi:hypothetical protein
MRIKSQLEMYHTVWFKLHGHVPELSLCEEELDIEAAVCRASGVHGQACNCLDSQTEPVGASTFDLCCGALVLPP